MGDFSSLKELLRGGVIFVVDLFVPEGTPTRGGVTFVGDLRGKNKADGLCRPFFLLVARCSGLACLLFVFYQGHQGGVAA